MTAKSVKFGTQPIARSAVTPEQWVESRVAEEEKMKRLTIDLPESLHRRVKIGCAERGEKMADVIRELLEKEFPQR
jgi:predicted DNA binding CopG/RHH family protein